MNEVKNFAVNTRCQAAWLCRRSSRRMAIRTAFPCLSFASPIIFLISCKANDIVGRRVHLPLTNHLLPSDGIRRYITEVPLLPASAHWCFLPLLLRISQFWRNCWVIVVWPALQWYVVCCMLYHSLLGDLSGFQRLTSI